MKLFFSFVVVAVVFVLSCKPKPDYVPRALAEVETELILRDSTLSIRAIEILDKNSLAFAANHNRFGLYSEKDKKWIISKQEYDSLAIEFRAVAGNIQDFFMLSVGSPALLFKTGNSGAMELVYTESHEKAFYDAIRFWNEKEGIAIGDPTERCMSIIVTRDGGETWKKIPCNQLPEARDGEVAFAASNSNIAMVGNHTWVATGGKASRILYSADKGYTWEIYETPIIQGLETTGIFAVDFYDELNGFAIGGDYTQPDDNSANKIVTHDGGKTWHLVAENQEPGYRSCVQYIPGTKGKELVAIGFKGIDFSNDGGYTWKHLSNEGFYTLRFVNDTVAYAAGKGRIAKLTFRE